MRERQGERQSKLANGARDGDWLLRREREGGRGPGSLVECVRVEADAGICAR